MIRIVVRLCRVEDNYATDFVSNTILRYLIHDHSKMFHLDKEKFIDHVQVILFTNKHTLFPHLDIT